MVEDECGKAGLAEVWPELGSVKGADPAGRECGSWVAGEKGAEGEGCVILLEVQSPLAMPPTLMIAVVSAEVPSNCGTSLFPCCVKAGCQGSELQCSLSSL